MEVSLCVWHSLQGLIVSKFQRVALNPVNGKAFLIVSRIYHRSGNNSIQQPSDSVHVQPQMADVNLYNSYSVQVFPQELWDFPCTMSAWVGWNLQMYDEVR